MPQCTNRPSCINSEPTRTSSSSSFGVIACSGDSERSLATFIPACFFARCIAVSRCRGRGRGFPLGFPHFNEPMNDASRRRRINASTTARLSKNAPQMTSSARQRVRIVRVRVRARARARLSRSRYEFFYDGAPFIDIINLTLHYASDCIA